MAKSGGNVGNIMNGFDSSSLYRGDTGSSIGNSINAYMSDTPDYGTIGNAADAYINNRDDYGTIGNSIDSYVNGNNWYGNDNQSSFGARLAARYNANPDLYNKLGGALAGSIFAIPAGQQNRQLRANQIKASFYKNPLLNASLGQPTDYSDYYADFMNNLYLNKVAQEAEQARQRGLV